MKIRTKSTTPKFVMVAIIVGLLLVGAGTAYIYFKSTSPHPVTQSTPTTQTSTQPSGVVNYNGATNDQQTAGSTAKNQAPSQNTTDTSSTNTIKVTLQGTKPRLTALLAIVTNDGTCTLTLTGPTTTTINATIQAQSNYSVCTGFDTSSLAAGNWTAKVDVKSGTQTGTATQTFTVQ